VKRSAAQPRHRNLGRRLSVRPSPHHRILAAARTHFFRHGFRNVTMDDLAAELGISKKTLYAHYPGKDALLDAVLRDKLERVRGTLRQATKDPRQEFPALLQNLLAGLQRELEELQPPFLRDMGKAPEAFKRQDQRRTRLIRDHFGRLFREGQRSGDLRSDIPAHLMIETLLAAVHAIINPQKLNELRMSPQETFAGLIDLLLHGAVQRKKGGKR